ERRRARRERDEAVRKARDAAEELVEQLRSDVKDVRRTLDRGSVTAPALDAAMAGIDERVGQLPGTPDEPPVDDEAVAAELPPRDWQVGDRARSRSGGWEGRIVALERGGRRASLEAGGVRVRVETADLIAAASPSTGQRSAPDATAASNVAALRLARART